MPNDFPPIKVEAQIKGKKVSMNFKATQNTSVFAHSIFDLLEQSKEVTVQIISSKVSKETKEETPTEETKKTKG